MHQTYDEFPVDLKIGLLVDSKTAVHKPTIMRDDSRWDWIDDAAGIGSFVIRFSVNDFAVGSGQSYFKLIGSADFQDGELENGWMIYVWKQQPYSGQSLVFFNGYTGSGFGHQVAAIGPTFLQSNVVYDLVVVKNGATIRFYLNTIAQSTVISNNNPGRIPTGKFPITLAGVASLDNASSKVVVTVHEVIAFNEELDRWAGIVDTTDINTMCIEGNFVPARRKAHCIAHYAAQEPDGFALYDCVEQYNSWKVAASLPILINNHIQLLGYNGNPDVMNHSDWITDSTWNYDSGTGTLTQPPTSGQNYASVGVGTMKVDVDYCLRFNCTQADNACLIFLNNGGDYSSFYFPVTTGPNAIYFKGKGGNRISFINNSSPTNGFSASDFVLEELEVKSRYDIRTKLPLGFKVRFKDPGQFLELPYSQSNDIAPNVTNRATYIIDVTALTISTGCTLIENKAFSIRLVKIGSNLFIRAKLIDNGSGTLNQVEVDLGSRSSLPETRFTVIYDNIDYTNRIAIAVNGNVLAQADGVVGTIATPATSVPLFKPETGDVIDGHFFSMFSAAFPIAEIATYGKFGFPVTDPNLLGYFHLRTIYVGNINGTFTVAGAGKIGVFQGFTDAEIKVATMPRYNLFPELRNALLVDAGQVTYPAGAVVLGIDNYNVLAYLLKSGESLDTRQELELLANGRFSNPTADILVKLDGYWQHNELYDDGGTPSLLDWVGTNHLPVTGGVFSAINSLR